MSYRVWCHNCRWTVDADSQEEATRLAHEHSVNPRHRDGVHTVEYAAVLDTLGAEPPNTSGG